MFKKLFSIFAALTLSAGLWAKGSVFTYTATEKLEDQFDKLGVGGVESHDFNNGNGTVTYDEEITAIEHSAFAGCTALQSITLPTSVTTIGNEAFNRCSNLQSINLSNVTVIGGSAFYACTSLQSIDMLNITTIGETAFNSCESLQSITLPATLTTIEALAFNLCTGVTSVTFLGTSCTIGEDAFATIGVSTPAALTLPAGWTGTKPAQDGSWYGGKFKVDAPAPKVGDTFEDATSGLKFEVTAVGETNTVKVIHNNYSGTTYTVPATVKYNEDDFTVTEIGDNAFDNCSSLESITLPAGLTTIGESAFIDCTKLISITIPESVTTIEQGAFYECTSLESINIPAGVTTIESDVFNNCEKLQSIILPADVTTIGAIAFAGSGLQTITIPAGVTSLGMGAFAECADLTSVTFLGNACQDAIGEMAFYGVGNPTPAALTLPDTWTGSKPDEEGNWYSGKFELVSGPTALPTLFGEGVKGNKFMHKGQLIIRSGNKKYNALGQKL